MCHRNEYVSCSNAYVYVEIGERRRQERFVGEGITRCFCFRSLWATWLNRWEVNLSHPIQTHHFSSQLLRQCIFATLFSWKCESVKSNVFAIRNDQDLIIPRRFQSICLFGSIHHPWNLPFHVHHPHITSPIFDLKSDRMSHKGPIVTPHVASIDLTPSKGYVTERMPNQWTIQGVKKVPGPPAISSCALFD
jgi:hypothetical protein